jgi:hypothetical protein
MMSLLQGIYNRIPYKALHSFVGYADENDVVNDLVVGGHDVGV